MKTAIVTGATGFIGSRLALKLLKQGWIVHVLGRSKNSTSFETRIFHAIDDITGVPENRALFKNLFCHDVDICNPRLEMQNLIHSHHFDSETLLFHVAGDTRFNPPSPEMQHNINVSGPLNIIKAFHNHLSKVVHVSTAYVAGKRKGKILEGELDEGQEHRNNYEKSKLSAEVEVTKLCEQLELPLCITRPSIIINDSVTGRSPTLTHFNALVYVVTRIQKHFKNDKNVNPSKEFRMPIDPTARPNLAPVNPIVDALIKVGTESTAPCKTYHLCHPHPQSNYEIVKLMAQAFGIQDFINLSFVYKFPEKFSYTEEMMLRSLKQYLPYLNEYCEFDVTNTRSIIPDYDSTFPVITPDYLDKVIYYQRHRQLRESHH
ncbi:SDR family oxidoreductase [Maribellus sediminis]|uniref:SDR family oxidoreductase n=1 Tax=Maribellus sediminis TaxID=2696285 RepID=UPI001432292D|nr:SDR family oxidoreductase [Maribellus sediminis]